MKKIITDAELDEVNAGSIDYVAIGGRIRNARKQIKMTQVELGQAVDLSTSFVGHVERGSRKASLETIIHIGEVLNLSLDILLTGKLHYDETQLAGIHKDQILSGILRILEKHVDEWTLALDPKTIQTRNESNA